jgi:hypothetical protein
MALLLMSASLNKPLAIIAATIGNSPRFPRRYFITAAYAPRALMSIGLWPLPVSMACTTREHEQQGATVSRFREIIGAFGLYAYSVSAITRGHASIAALIRIPRFSYVSPNDEDQQQRFRKQQGDGFHHRSIRAESPST